MKLIHSYYQKLNNRFIKNFITLFSGSAISQVIIFITIPIITRLYTEEAFGIYVLFSSTLLTLKAITSFNLELSILVPKRDKDAINLLILNLCVVTISNIIVLLFISIFKNKLLKFIDLESIGNYIYLIPFSLMFVGYTNALEYWSNRNNNFKYLSIYLISKSSVLSVSQIGIGISSFRKLGLVPGLVLGQITGFFILLKANICSIKNQLHHVSVSRIFFLLGKYRDIPIFNTIISFINNTSNELPVLLLSKYFGLAPAGIYGLAAKISKAPSGVIGYSASQVFFNEASKTYNIKGNMTALINKTYKGLFYTSLLIFIPLFIISFYFDNIFGKNWNDVGLYTRIMIPWLFLAFVNSPVSSLINILNKQKLFFYSETCLLILRFISFYIGYKVFNDVLISLVFFSGVGFIFSILYMLYFIQKSKTLNRTNKNF